MPLTLGITDCKEWANYERWIKGYSEAEQVRFTMGQMSEAEQVRFTMGQMSEAEQVRFTMGQMSEAEQVRFTTGQMSEKIDIVRLNSGKGETSFVSHCDGIILTGGEDVSPSLYGKPEYVEQYQLRDCNIERDKFEFGILKEAGEYNIPVLGICRGLQLANVYAGGTLIPDLPATGKTGHSAGTHTDSVHGVTITRGSKLDAITGVEKGEVNSHHHQAADKIGKGLVVTSLSDDGVVEGIEKSKKHDNEFFILVQWHPERMDIKSPFSGKLREAFLKACEEYNRYSSLNQSISATP